MGRKCVNYENLCEIRRDNVNCEKCMCNDLKVMCNLLVTALIIASLLIVSRNVKLIPGPMKKCLKCEKMMPTRSNNCKCGYLLCYVAVRVLHFSAFILSLQSSSTTCIVTATVSNTHAYCPYTQRIKMVLCYFMIVQIQ